MNEKNKTLAYIGGAILLALIAFFVKPTRLTPDAFLDQGELFFPDFTDPNSATTLEVIDFDEATGAAHPFKVTFADGRWTIPSHHDYPADGADRLAQTAAGVIDIRKDDFRSDNVSDHALCGVVDPLDESGAGLTGRGKRVTIKGANDDVLADFIVGKLIEGRQKMRFVRVPGQKRVYAARMDIDISTKFADWIETDLLKIDKDKINRFTLNNYSINERTGSVDQRDNMSVARSENGWTGREGKKRFDVDTTKVEGLLKVIDSLVIVGVRPKPEGISANLSTSVASAQLDQADVRSLRSKGFYITRSGQLMSNEGELKVQTEDGIIYTLRFGEILYGSGLLVSAGGDDTGEEEAGQEANRYLFVTADFDINLLSEPPRPASMSFEGKADSVLTPKEQNDKRAWETHQGWESRVQQSQKLANELNARFADWYYVISADSFDKLHAGREGVEAGKS